METISFNGNIATPTNGFNLAVDVRYEQDIAINQTKIIAVQGYVKRNNSTYHPYNSTSNCVFTVKGINSDGSQTQIYTTTKHPSYNINSNSYKQVLDLSQNTEGFPITISHLDNGKKSIVITFSFNGKLDNYYPNGTISKTVELPTIARKSSVTCADGNIGSATTININRASSTFTHTLEYNFLGLTGTIATKTSSTSIGWTIPTSFYAKIPNANSGKGTITCSTYSGNTLIGTSTCTFNAFVVNSNPTISGTVEDTNTSAITATGDKNKLIRYISNAKVVITATAKNSATISSVKVVNGSQTKTTSTSTINSVDSDTFNLSCTDSRGLTATKTITKEFIEYIKPVVVSALLSRPTTTSNTINASVQGLCFNGNFGVKTNSFELKWRYKKSTETTWGNYTTVTATRSGNNFNFSGELGTDFSYTESYNFEFVISDTFISNTHNTTVTRGLPIIDIGENDVNINGDILCRGQKIPLVYKYTADLSSLDPNTYYPVVGYGLPKKGMSHLKLAVELNSETKPSWSTHDSGFSCNLDLLNEAGTWGTTNAKGIVLEYDYKHASSQPVSYTQLTNSSSPVFWCRGGGQYYIWTDYDETWTIYTSSVTLSSQTIAPQSTLPTLTINYSQIRANLNGSYAYFDELYPSKLISPNNNFMRSGNEFNFVPGSGTPSAIFFNYKAGDTGSSTSQAITEYRFCNGQGGNLANIAGNIIYSKDYRVFAIDYRDVSFSKTINAKSYEYVNLSVPEISGFFCVACSVYYGSGSNNGYIQVNPRISGDVALYNPTNSNVTDTFYIRYIYLQQ